MVAFFTDVELYMSPMELPPHLYIIQEEKAALAATDTT